MSDSVFLFFSPFDRNVITAAPLSDYATSIKGLREEVLVVTFGKRESSVVASHAAKQLSPITDVRAQPGDM